MYGAPHNVWGSPQHMGVHTTYGASYNVWGSTKRMGLPTTYGSFCSGAARLLSNVSHLCRFHYTTLHFRPAFAGNNILNNKLTNLNTTNCTFVWCITNIYNSMFPSHTPVRCKRRRSVGLKCSKGTSSQAGWERACSSPGSHVNRQPLCALGCWWSIKACGVYSITFRILPPPAPPPQVKGPWSSSTGPGQRRAAQLTFRCLAERLKKRELNNNI